MAATYPRSGLHPTGKEMLLKFDSESYLSFGDFSNVLKDVESILEVSAKEVAVRSRLSQGRRGGAALVIKEFRPGSLAILSDPYISSVSAGVLGNAIFAVFLYVMNRINGRPMAEKADLQRTNSDAISEDKLKAAAAKAVEMTSNHRRRLKEKRQTFGLSITITVENKTHEVTED